MRVLLVKLSSMGDVIHTLPAITDAVREVPGIKFTWIIEEAFQEIASWHPAVERVIPIALRKRNFKQVRGAIRELRSQQFDLVLDAQGLIKSAVITRLARTKNRAGGDWGTCRESIASLFYNRKYSVAKDQHAVVRLRQLFAKTFGYTVPAGPISYGVNIPDCEMPNIWNNTNPYLVFLHGTTWDSKHWPDEYWVALANLVAQQGLKVQVTWATQQQKARAQMLADKCSNVTMLPHLSINQAAAVLSHAYGVVAVDTGFAHLSAALDKPMVAIYGSTVVKKAGTVGNNNVNLASKFSCAPCGQRSCTYSGAKPVNPPCYQEISPRLVWQKLAVLLEKI
jgi:heptosyltransferase-1